MVEKDQRLSLPVCGCPKLLKPKPPELWVGCEGWKGVERDCFREKGRIEKIISGVTTKEKQL